MSVALSRVARWSRRGSSLRRSWRGETRSLLWIVGVFFVIYHLPLDSVRFQGAVVEALALTRWYAREHVLLCLVPAFFIAGAISVFVRQDAVLRYLGPHAPKPVAYGVASVSGSLLAVCSCTVLPLFGGIYLNGAGLGPAAAFLYAGPAINVMAVILTARVLGADIGAARAVGAVVFAVVLGLLMHLVFRRSEAERARNWPRPTQEPAARPLWQTFVFFAALTGILIFANWGAPIHDGGLWAAVYGARWTITAGFGVVLALSLWRWMGLTGWDVGGIGAATVAAALVAPTHPTVPFAVATLGVSLAASASEEEAGDWFRASWGFAKQILPLLLAGVLVAGLLLGRPGHEGLMPQAWVAESVGGNSLGANVFASVAGAFMYFATLTEVPILQGLLGSGMGRGPALALLLAGPAISLPSVLVIRSFMGWKRTGAFLLLVVAFATLTGMIFGAVG